MPPLDGRVALVTGASGGIGAAVARSLHDAGASVGLLSRRGEDLGLERGLGIACDVSDRAAVERATAEVVERFGAPPHRGGERGRGLLRPVPRARPRRPRGHDRREPQGHALHRGRRAPPPDRVGRGRLRLARERRRRARVPGRGRLQRVEVRAGRLHACARPRAAREGRARHEHRARRREHGVRDRHRPRARGPRRWRR